MTICECAVSFVGEAITAGGIVKTRNEIMDCAYTIGAGLNFPCTAPFPNQFRSPAREPMNSSRTSSYCVRCPPLHHRQQARNTLIQTGLLKPPKSVSNSRYSFVYCLQLPSAVCDDRSESLIPRFFTGPLDAVGIVQHRNSHVATGLAHQLPAHCTQVSMYSFPSSAAFSTAHSNGLSACRTNSVFTPIDTFAIL